MLTGAAMAAFAGNSVICRLALRQTTIDPATFTMIRLVSGAAALLTLVYIRSAIPDLRAARQADGVPRARANRLALHLGGSWIAAAVLLLYAATFSYAYVQLQAGAGALLLFGAVQLTMVLYGWYGGERMTLRQASGFLLATLGLLAMMAPGLTAPPLGGALLMLTSGVAWAAYSLRGRGSADPIGDTAGNFGRAAPLSLMLWPFTRGWLLVDFDGALYAILSGVVTSGFGYVLWYTVLPKLGATRAASVQLIVPVLAAFAGIAFMGELPMLRLLFSSIAVLGGVSLTMLDKRRNAARVDKAMRGEKEIPKDVS